MQAHYHQNKPLLRPTVRRQQRLPRLAAWLFCLTFLFGIYTSPVIALTYEISDAANWNLRFDGPENTYAPYPWSSALTGLVNDIESTRAVDLNNNGKPDLIITAPGADYNSRNDSGSVYIIFDATYESYTTTGSTIDLADPASYNLRYDGPMANSYLSYGALKTGDIDNDGRIDLLIGAYGTDTNKGSLYVVANSLITSYTGTGNNIDLNTTANFNVRYDGVAAGDILSDHSLFIADLNNNGIDDILVGGYRSSNNGLTSSGSIFLIYDDLVALQTNGTGNTIALSNSNNFTLRFDGSAENEWFGFTVSLKDVDNNGKNDILTGANADKGGVTDRGSVYVIYDSIIESLVGNQKTADLALSDNYFSIRYDGAVANDFLGHDSMATDLNNNGSTDLLLSACCTDFGDKNGRGSLYIVYDSLIADYPGTGNAVDLSNLNNFNVRFDGAEAGDYLSVHSFQVGDFNGNGLTDLFIGGYGVDNGTETNAGALYVIYDSIIDNYSGTQNVVDLSAAGTYSLKYNGETTDEEFGYGSILNAVDINQDGKIDLTPSGPLADFNSRTNSGSLYIIYNFPHALSLNSTNNSYTNDPTPTINGTVNAANSTTTIAAVQYSLDNATFAGGSGGWTDCSAADGAFNSTSEEFSCTVDTLTEGAHTVYFRAYDANTSYTAISAYASVSFTVDATAPTAPLLLSPASDTVDNTPTLVFAKATDNYLLSSYSIHLDNGAGRSYSLTGIPASGNGLFSYLWQDNPTVRVEFTNENDTDINNDQIKVSFKQLASRPLSEGKHAWSVTAYDQAGNSVAQSQDFYLDRTAPKLSELAIAGVSLVWPNRHYRLTLANRQFSLSGKATDFYQGSTITNTDRTTDAFDKVSSGPSSIELVIQRLRDGDSPSSGSPTYLNHLSQEYSLTEIKDFPPLQKTGRFFISLPYPLVDGYYRVNLILKDGASNTYHHPHFYVSINYRESYPRFPGLNPGQTLETRIVHQEQIPARTPTEKEQIRTQGYSVKIKVVDQRNSPIAGAKVTLYSTPQEQKTNSAGEALFANVEPGDHRLVVEYQNQSGEGQIRLTGEVQEFRYTIKIQPRFRLFGLSSYPLILLGTFSLTSFLLYRLFNKDHRVVVGKDQLPKVVS